MGRSNSMVMKIAYQNVGKGNMAQHAWMENCRQKEVDIFLSGRFLLIREDMERST